MAPEKAEKPSQSALDRVDNLFSKGPDGPKSFMSFRFKGGGLILIYPMPEEGPDSGYLIEGRRSIINNGNLDTKVTSFLISKEGISYIELIQEPMRQSLKIGDHAVEFQTQHQDERLKVNLREESVKNRQKMASTLVDWLDEVIKKQEYSHPPVSLNIAS